MRKLLGVVAALTVMAPLGTTVAYADYNSSSDVTIALPVNTGVSSTGTTTYNLQQGVQSTLTSTTGIQDTYSFVWITNADGTPILAIDPPKPMMR